MHVVCVHRGVYPERVGGTYSYIHELYRRLAARGHDVDVIASTQRSSAPPPFDLEGLRIHAYAYRRVNPVASALQHLRNIQLICEQIAADRSIDILTIHDALVGPRLAQSPLGRSVCQLPTFHAPAFLEFRYNTAWEIKLERSPIRRLFMRSTEPFYEYWQRRFQTDVLRAADGIVVLSEYSRGHIETEFPSVDISKVVIIPSGVDTERFKPAADRDEVRADLGLERDALYLVTVRNLSPRMGLENLVDAMPQVLGAAVERELDVRLLVCGEGRLRRSLEEQISGLGLSDSVTLLGRISDEDLRRYYQASDLFVLPTAAMEGFGIVTVEALSANLPVVGTPAGATSEILAPIDQRLVTTDTSPEAIADGIISWFSRHEQDRATSRYRDEVLGKYSWERVTERVERYYEEMVAEFRKKL